MFLKRNLLAALAILIFSANSFGQFNLQITEIWMGNEPGNNLTEDWFEITNLGSTPWVESTDGFLWYDDESADATTADIITGVSMIAPGETVVLVDGEDGSGDNVNEFLDVWNTVKPQGQVGSYEGSGLGAGGDSVTLWISPTMPVEESAPGAGDATPIADFETYPTTLLNGGQSWDSELGAFSAPGNASGAVVTTIINDEGQPAIGSPGMVVPEPASLSIVLLGFLGLGALRLR